MTLNDSIPFVISFGLQNEMDHLRNEEAIVYDSLQKLKDSMRNTFYEATTSELQSKLSPNSKIIDLGCGFGETSLLLATAGHEVHMVEPALNRCRALAKSLDHLKLTGNVYVCTAEDIDKISLKRLDAALFFSSLHHCDYPQIALKKVRQILNPKGVIMIVEPILKFYMTKKRYYKQLVENPVKLGHYGGNEHIYSFKEYYNMLKDAGFCRIEFFWAYRKVDPRKTFIRDLSSCIKGRYQHTVLRCLVKFVIHSLLKKMCASKFLNRCVVGPMIKMSLLQASFIAYRS